MRTIDEIYSELVAYKSTFSELNGLNNPSNTAIWRLWLRIVAFAVWIVENFLDLHKKEVDMVVKNQKIGTPRWYVEITKNFQYGYALPVEQVYYTTIDENAKIVKQCSAKVDNDGVLVIKVAKDSSGNLVPLTAGEVTALEAYLDKVQFAGVRLRVATFPADLLRLTATVYYDGQIPLATFQNSFETAVKTYLKNIPFDSVFVLNHLIDAIQSVSGCIDVSVSEWRFARHAEPDKIAGRIYETKAGYAKTDSNTFTSVTFIPQ
jgi:hypothetical protein